MRSALIISNNNSDISILKDALSSEMRFDFAIDHAHALGILQKTRYDIIFADMAQLLKHADTDSPGQILDNYKTLYPTIDVVLMTPQALTDQAVGWVKKGASNYITYPLSPDEICLVTESISASILQQSELDYLRDQFWKTEALGVIQTDSPEMKDVFKKIRSVAPTKTTVLLTGETGTGKSLLAKLIHQHSNRQQAQFISVHCGAIPDTLLESELFGHEKGAFTGAVRKKLGKFEIADGGTIFLDEVGTLTPSAQIKLLQVLQDGTFYRVGGDESLQTNARIIAATNDDLKEMSGEGRFRKDLYYRLNVFPVEIVPLRSRPQDLPRLIDRFLERLNLDFQKQIHGVHPRVIQALSEYDWPGNVRELENILERAYILETSDQLTPSSLPNELFNAEDLPAFLPVDDSLPLAEARRHAVADFEREYLKSLLTRHNGRINVSATAAGITTRQLHKLLAKYGIRKEDFKVKK